jgi:hypothetical protein
VLTSLQLDCREAPRPQPHFFSGLLVSRA